MILEKPPLFGSRKEFGFVIAVLAAIMIFRLSLYYNDYRKFIGKPFYYTNATVLMHYTKKSKNRSYEVLKLRGEKGMTFYTIANLSQDVTGKIVRVKILPSSSISFFDYLGTFYTKSTLRVIGDLQETGRSRVLNAIASQHTDPEMVAFYQAIFLAAPVSKKLREKISGLGVSHLVALSGFHLAILWGVIYGILGLIYRPAQQRWFPYRSMLLDIGVLTVGILGAYLWFVDFPPSLLRSYTMLLIAWAMLLLGIELVSFQFLGFVIAVLLVLFPGLLASLGFWFSVAGVFYIYLVLYWSQHSGIWLQNRWIISLLSIPIGIFVLMLPIVHTVFGTTCRWQLLAPLLSLLFVIFYPISIGVHLIGMGNLFDHELLWLFALPAELQSHLLPAWASSAYILLSIASIWSRTLFATVTGLALVYLFYLLLFIQ